MKSGEDKTTPVPDPAVLMAQAAASLDAPLQRALGLPWGAQPEASGRSWVERMLAPYQQALGALAGLMPRVLERVGQVVGLETGQQVLFRARPPNGQCNGAEKHFYDFLFMVRDVGQPLVTPDLSARLKVITEAHKDTRDALRALIQDPRRTDLPRLLDDLKHEVRANRMQGFVKVREALQWLMGAKDGDEYSAAYVLLEQLSDALGETCLHELRRRDGMDMLWSPALAADLWAQPLRACFATFGHQLSDLVSVIKCGPPNRYELLVMDHGHDRCFEIRQGDGSSAAEPWSGGGEIRGAEPGRDFLIGEKHYKLPMRDHDAAQGFATWSVDQRLVQESRDCFPTTSGIDMRAWDMGGARSPVALFFVHHRDTDAGEYYELGLSCFVAPRKDPLSVGIATLGAVLVSSKEGKDVGETIWGFPKQHVDRSSWTVQYRPNHLECRVELTAATLTMRLPRSGASFASALPMLLYTRKPSDGGGQWHRSVLMRFARGESLRSAASGVVLSVEVKGEEAFGHPLLGELYRLGLIDGDGRMRSHALHAAWAEHVSTQLNAATPVPLPEPEFD